MSKYEDFLKTIQNNERIAEGLSSQGVALGLSRVNTGAEAQFKQAVGNAETVRAQSDANYGANKQSLVSAGLDSTGYASRVNALADAQKETSIENAYASAVSAQADTINDYADSVASEAEAQENAYASAVEEAQKEQESYYTNYNKLLYDAAYGSKTPEQAYANAIISGLSEEDAQKIKEQAQSRADVDTQNAEITAQNKLTETYNKLLYDAIYGSKTAEQAVYNALVNGITDETQLANIRYAAEQREAEAAKKAESEAAKKEEEAKAKTVKANNTAVAKVKAEYASEMAEDPTIDGVYNSLVANSYSGTDAETVQEAVTVLSDLGGSMTLSDFTGFVDGLGLDDTEKTSLLNETYEIWSKLENKKTWVKRSGEGDTIR